jgi:hypothetical protein
LCRPSTGPGLSIRARRYRHCFSLPKGSFRQLTSEFAHALDGDLQIPDLKTLPPRRPALGRRARRDCRGKRRRARRGANGARRPAAARHFSTRGVPYRSDG